MPNYDPITYQMIVVAHALDFYLRTGTQVNRAYTPKRMMATAARLTHRSFKPREYGEAAAALRACAKERTRLTHIYEDLAAIKITVEECQ